MGYETKGFEYSRKTHVTRNIDSSAVVEGEATKASIHDSIMVYPMIGTIRDHRYFRMDAAYGSLTYMITSWTT